MHSCSHSHPSSHSHHDPQKSSSALLFAFILNFSFCLIEAVGGYYASSQAIMADALHDFGDSLSLLLLIALRWVAFKPATESFSFGYRRLNIIGAALVGGTLVFGCILILGHSLPKLWKPQEVNSGLMMILSVLGMVANGLAFYRLRSHTHASSPHHDHTHSHSHSHSHSHGNTSAGVGENLVSLHLLEDLWGWVIVFIGALAIHFFSWYWLDPLLSVFLAFFILWRSFAHLQQIGRLFLLGSSADFSVNKITEVIQSVKGVVNHHHVHVWELDSGFHIITAHLVIEEKADVVAIKQQIRQQILEIGKCEMTLEVEREGELCLDPMHPTHF